MRLVTCCCVLLFLAGICVAQDTNFPAGPQYLMNYGSPLLLQPIATPTLSFAPAPASVPVAATEVTAGTPAVPASGGVQPQTDLPRIYYGGPNVAENAAAKASEIEVTSQEPPNLPESIVNVGVTEMLDAHTLRERGYGMTPGEAAAFRKTHKTRTSHVYTNADIARLHGG